MGCCAIGPGWGEGVWTMLFCGVGGVIRTMLSI